MNARNLIPHITSEDTRAADIVVFPEGALNFPQNSIRVPRPEESILPCQDASYTEFFRNISCAAMAAKKYVVVNVYMQTDCSAEAILTNDTRPCTNATQNINVYSTTVVFARDGRVVAR